MATLADDATLAAQLTHVMSDLVRGDAERPRAGQGGGGSEGSARKERAARALTRVGAFARARAHAHEQRHANALQTPPTLEAARDLQLRQDDVLRALQREVADLERHRDHLRRENNELVRGTPSRSSRGRGSARTSLGGAEDAEVQQIMCVCAWTQAGLWACARVRGGGRVLTFQPGCPPTKNPAACLTQRVPAQGEPAVVCAGPGGASGAERARPPAAERERA